MIAILGMLRKLQGQAANYIGYATVKFVHAELSFLNRVVDQVELKLTLHNDLNFFMFLQTYVLKTL